MKMVLIVLGSFLSLFLVYCNPTRKAQTVNVPVVTYLSDIKPIIASSCSPCHIPPKGNKKPFDTYARASADIDDIISRIIKDPGDPGFMPFKQAHRLPDTTIQKFENWKAGGLKEN